MLHHRRTAYGAEDLDEERGVEALEEGGTE